MEEISMSTYGSLDTLIVIINILIEIVGITMLGIFLYYIIISMFAWSKRKEKPADFYPPKHSFAVLIAAHNEERVIANIIESV